MLEPFLVSIYNFSGNYRFLFPRSKISATICGIHGGSFSFNYGLGKSMCKKYTLYYVYRTYIHMHVYICMFRLTICQQ